LFSVLTTRCARACYEGIDLEASKERGITVSKGFFDGLAVSEHTLMLILAILRKLIPSHASMVMGEWKQFEFNAAMCSFAGLTLGILGLGTRAKRVFLSRRYSM
jgi:lactate dehydrogenase-like 2-hydroxyacid dehydrogenase